MFLAMILNILSYALWTLKNNYLFFLFLYFNFLINLKKKKQKKRDGCSYLINNNSILKKYITFHSSSFQGFFIHFTTNNIS